MAFWDMLWNILMYFFYGIGILILIGIILSIIGWIWDVGKSIIDYIKYIFSGWPSIKKKALFVAFKNHKKSKKNINNFWEDLQEENPDLYEIFYKDYDYCNNLLQERDKQYPKIKLVKTWWYDKEKDIHWSGTKEVEIWDE